MTYCYIRTPSKNTLITLLLVMLIASLMDSLLQFVPRVHALNIESIDSIKVDVDGDGVAEEDLSRESHEAISIPCDGKKHIIEVKGKAKNKTKEVGLEVWDDDAWFTGADDQLDDKKVNPNPDDGSFTIKLEVWSKTTEYNVDVKLGRVTFQSGHITGPMGSSGEQTAEIFIKDGDSIWPSEDGYWTFACDKFHEKIQIEIDVPKLHNFSRTNLYVPAYALSGTTVFTEENALPTPSPLSVPATYKRISEAFDLGPANVTFAKPITVLVQYSNEEIDALQELTLNIFKFDPVSSSWSPILTSVDAANNILEFNTTQLGTFGFTGKMPIVGGIAVPVDKFALLTPYIGLASTITIGAVATVVYVKRIKRRKEKQ